jgi:hypothetical protein
MNDAGEQCNDCENHEAQYKEVFDHSLSRFIRKQPEKTPDEETAHTLILSDRGRLLFESY